MISSPQCTSLVETVNTIDITAMTLNSLKQKQTVEIYDPNRVTLHDSPGNLLEAQPASSLLTQKPDQGSFGDDESLNKKGKASLYNDKVFNQSGKKKIGLYSGNDHTLLENIRPGGGTSSMNCEKPTIPGPDYYGRSSEPPSSQYDLKEFRHDLSQEGTTDYLKGLGSQKNHHRPSSLEVTAYENSMLAKHASPKSKSVECRHADVALYTEAHKNDDKMAHSLSRLHHVCRQHSDGALSPGFRSIEEVDMTLASQPANRDLQTYRKDNSESPNIRKGKEPVCSNLEDSVGISMERGESQESVESINSRKPISTGKRPLSPDPSISEISSTLKRRRNEDSYSGSLVKQDSCFMNWISAITCGYTKSELATPLAFLPHSSPGSARDLSSFPVPNERIEDPDKSSRPLGFKSIFESIYQPRIKKQNSQTSHLHFPSDELAHSRNRAVSEQLFQGSSPMVCDNVPHNVVPTTTERINNGLKRHVSTASLKLVAGSCNLHDRVSVSSDRRSQGNSHFEDLALSYQEAKHKNGEMHSPTEVGPSILSAKVVADPPPETASVPKESLDAVTNSSSFLKNLWLQRLLPKSSSSPASTIQRNRSMVTINEKLPRDCSMLDRQVVFASKENKLGTLKFPSLEGPKVIVKNTIPDQPTSVIDPCCSERTIYQKSNSNLHPILSPQRVKSAEQTTTIFAKRLDAFKLILPSGVSNDATCSTTVCFFCGKTGHNIHICAELDEAERGDLMKNMNSHKRTVNSSCFCIRCFQINHWAVFCPHMSSRNESLTNSTSVVGDHECTRMTNKPGNPSFSRYDEKPVFWSNSESERHQECKSLQKGKRSVETNLPPNPCVNSGLNPVKGSRSTYFCSQENESRGNQMLPYCHFRAIDAADDSDAIFERMRRLQMSRTNIIRLIKSPVPHFSLEGFFLRLRLGECDEGSEGTGYHVARINGVDSGNGLAVCIGSFTYLADFHSVSNQAFSEDELKCWWSKTLADGGKPPTLEELNKKIQDRVKLGF